MLGWLFETVGANTSAAVGDGLTLSAVLGSEYFTLILSGVIAFIVSYVTQWYFARPKIKAAIFNVSMGQLTYTSDSKISNYTLITPYVYITNHRQNAIFIFDYEMDIDFGDGFVKLQRIYGRAIPWPEPYTTETPTERISISNFADKLIYASPKMVAFGEIIKGFVPFGGDPSLHGKTIKRIKFTCVDALQNRHTSKLTPKMYLNHFLFHDLVDATVTSR
jgi:hypothetical protein